MSPTWAMGPVLSRCCETVCETCPALHAVSATGQKSSTPRAAARTARFTAVDLQQARAGHRGDRWQWTDRAYRAPPRLRPQGSRDVAPPLFGGHGVQIAVPPADDDRRSTGGEWMRTGLAFDD